MISGITSAVVGQTPQTKTAVAEKTSDFADALKSAVASQQKQGTSLDDIFSRASQKYHVPVKLLKAVAKAESDFQADAVSSCGAQGMMQLMPSTARSLGVTDSFDPEQNIMGGAKYLGQLLSSFGGDAKLAVAGYNAGGGAVRKYGGVPPYKETQNYVKKVLGYAGMDLSVPETAAVSGVSSLSEVPSAVSGTDSSSVSAVALGTDTLRLAAQMYVQRLKQNVLEATMEAAEKENRAD